MDAWKKMWDGRHSNEAGSSQKAKLWGKDWGSDEQLKQMNDLQKQYMAKLLETYKGYWSPLAEEAQNNIDQDPHGPAGEAFANAWVSMMSTIFAANPLLKEAMKVMYQQFMLNNPLISQEAKNWMHKALGASAE